jgi:copper homeostasis protein
VSVLLEIAVDSIDGAMAAAIAGADRLEVCAALSEGGLTPSAGLMRSAAQLAIPAFAMIRPRGGNFEYSRAEVDIMRHDIRAARSAGLAGLVFGALTSGDELDVAVLKELLTEADDLPVTLHRAFDLVVDPIRALDQAIDLGFRRILTSGQSASAQKGRDVLEQLASRAGDSIIVMPGRGIDATVVAELLFSDAFIELHAACRKPVPDEPRLAAFGFTGKEGASVTDSARVAALRSAIDKFSTLSARVTT